MTRLSHGCHSARAEPETHLCRLGTGGVTELHKQQLSDVWKEQKKKAIVFSSQVEPKKKVLWFSLGLFLWWNKCISLIQNAVVYLLRYPEGKYPEGAKWMQPLQPSQKAPRISLPLGKRGCPTERATVSRVQKTLRTQVTMKPAYFPSGPSTVAVLPLPRGCGQ